LIASFASTDSVVLVEAAFRPLAALPSTAWIIVTLHRKPQLDSKSGVKCYAPPPLRALIPGLEGRDRNSTSMIQQVGLTFRADEEGRDPQPCDQSNRRPAMYRARSSCLFALSCPIPPRSSLLCPRKCRKATFFNQNTAISSYLRGFTETSGPLTPQRPPAGMLRFRELILSAFPPRAMASCTGRAGGSGGCPWGPRALG